MNNEWDENESYGFNADSFGSDDNLSADNNSAEEPVNDNSSLPEFPVEPVYEPVEFQQAEQYPHTGEELNKPEYKTPAENNNLDNFTPPPAYVPEQPKPPVQPYNFQKPVNTQFQNGAAPMPNPQPNGKGKKAIIGIVIAAVVIALLIAVGSKLFSGDKKNTDITTTTSSQSIITNANNDNQTSADNQSSSVQYASPVALNELSAMEIADKCRPVSVGVLVYQSGQLSGEGSGVVMGFDAEKKYTYVMTCAHVIDDANVTYSIMVLDGTSKTAELVGYDTKTDIGVLKVEGTDYSVAQFGDSSQLKIGENVYAIGNPGGSDYFGSMTRGIVSAIDRSVSGTRNLTCIQHDAAINPGNSGGALVNSKGEVIGINSSKISDTDYEGMGFAVPINIAKSVAESLINYGYVPNRPKLGITYASVSNYQVYSMVVAIKGLPTGSLIITEISDDSSFVGTKAEKGDMIIAVNGKNMDKSDVLLDLIDKGAVGDTLTLTLCRVNSKTYATSTFDVTIKLVEDKGSKVTTTEESTNTYDYYYGNDNNSAGGFSDFFRDYFGF